MNPIEVSSVVKAYGSLIAVDGVSFSIREGEVFSLLGPNGAGKTTLIEILEGLRRKDSGEVQVLGLDPWISGKALHRRIGVIPQDFTFFENAIPMESLKYYSRIFGAKVDSEKILKEVLLDDKAGVRFQNLSGGQKQKLGLALSLVNSPELLFLDEPTTGLDPTARRAVWDVIRKLSESGRTILLTTHYLEEAELLSDRVAIMNNGHLIAMGTTDEIIDAHGSGELLEIRGGEELANYIKENTRLKVDYSGKGRISIALEQKGDALIALATVEQSGLEWSNLRTRQDSLEDVFVRLVGGIVEEHGDIKVQESSTNGKSHSIAGGR